MKRTQIQNKKYQKLISILYKEKEVKIWNGHFSEKGIPNPYIIVPSMGSITGFRNFMKMMDLDYKRDSDGLVVSSTKLSIEEMGNHINFLDILCAELEGI